MTPTGYSYQNLLVSLRPLVQITMNYKCCFYNEDECGPFTEPRISTDGLFSKNDLDNNVHHLRTIKIGKKSLPINLLTEKGLTEIELGKNFMMGTNYVQNIDIKWKFIGEHQ